jgi:hypothetical protein
MEGFFATLDDANAAVFVRAIQFAAALVRPAVKLADSRRDAVADNHRSRKVGAPIRRPDVLRAALLDEAASAIDEAQ